VREDLFVWDKGWDTLFDNQRWGRYPPVELVRVVSRNFSTNTDKSAIRILEIGCGPGANIWYLAREGFFAVGLDGSKVALEQARQYLEAESLSAELLEGDAMSLPFADGVFDAVIDIECIYANTLKDAGVIINEAHRVLKSGGFLFSITFTGDTSGYGTAVPDEPNTFTDYKNGPLHQGYGVVRLTAESEINIIYGVFDVIEYDSITRTDGNRKQQISEWLITGRKA